MSRTGHQNSINVKNCHSPSPPLKTLRQQDCESAKPQGGEGAGLRSPRVLSLQCWTPYWVPLGCPVRGRVSPPHTQVLSGSGGERRTYSINACAAAPASWSTLAIPEHLTSTLDIASLSVPDLIILCAAKSHLLTISQRKPPILQNKARE